MATTADFRNGLCLEYNGDLYRLVEFQHVKPGKGGAFVRTKLKNIKTGRVIENTFNSGVKIDVARVENRPYQYLYKDDLGYNFMHNETFEQISIPETMIEEPLILKEGLNVYIVTHADTETPLACEFPPFVEMQVEYTEPGLKGDTASSNALKPATLDTGLQIRVPLFIETGEWIKVDTRDMSYSERVKK
ncbi:MAG: elongation factor P [Bacteroidetes bacterium HGW-Bacteroidetes-21]|nr:MAG: elongation factor P [Bacteroidetes bacterium HGW-Bacteroidetes-21]